MNAYDLLKLDDRTREHITAQAFEVYDIGRHFSADEFPQLIDGDPLQDAFARYARAVVAVALNRVAWDRDAPLSDDAREHLAHLATGLDLFTVEIDDQA